MDIIDIIEQTANSKKRDLPEVHCMQNRTPPAASRLRIAFVAAYLFI